MDVPIVRSLARRLAAGAISALAIGSTAFSGPIAGSSFAIRPMIDADFVYLGDSVAPPSQVACNAAGRRCFGPAAMAHAYNYAGLHAAGNRGQGKTIAIVDSFGSDTIRHDLGVFNTAFGLPHLCGETGPSTPAGNCPPGLHPRFDIIEVQGSPPAVPPPPNNGTGQENHNLWDLEVSLDVEWAHATAPLANIMLVTTPTAETLGVQGFEQMMHAEDMVIENHMADVITQSFGAGEGSFHNGLASLNQLRQAFIDAHANKVTVFASSGDTGSTNILKEPVKNPAVIPYPSVIWPASDPLVTAVGGTFLCMDGATGAFVDFVKPPIWCRPPLNPAGEREPAWSQPQSARQVGSGGGYSILFTRPGYQDVLPPGSTYVGSTPGAPGPNRSMRGVPDIAYQASSRTGVLVYMTESLTTNQAGTGCGGARPCSTGWYVVGGTSASSPQWAGLIAIADQMAGHDLGFINPALYRLASNPARYHADFFDDDTNNNGCCGEPGWPSSPGWDAVTGLGSPNAGALLPDLIAAVRPSD
jgi:subtilase family serine protease